MSNTHSVTMLIRQVEQGGPGRDAAVMDLWKRYSDLLLGKARKALSQRLARRVGVDDLVQDVCFSVFRRLEEGKYEIGDRDDFLHLLMVVVRNKAASAGRGHTTKKKNVAREVEGDAGDEGRNSILDRVADPNASGADEGMILVEEVDERLRVLPENLREVVRLKLGGLTKAQICDRLDVVDRTIERRTALIRDVWRSYGMQVDVDDTPEEEDAGPGKGEPRREPIS